MDSGKGSLLPYNPSRDQQFLRVDPDFVRPSDQSTASSPMNSHIKPMEAGPAGRGLHPAFLVPNTSARGSYTDPRVSQTPINTFLYSNDDPWNGSIRHQPPPTIPRTPYYSYRNPATIPSDCGSSVGGVLPPSDSGYDSAARQSIADHSVISDLDRASENISTPLSELQLRGPGSNALDPFQYYSWSSVAAYGTVTNNAPTRSPFSCHHCPFSARTNSELRKHVARHIKPFHCDEPDCKNQGRGFGTRNDLDRHKRSVHHKSDECYFCSLCPPNHRRDKPWPRADNFRSHLKNVHGRDFNSTVSLDDFKHRSSAESPVLASVGSAPELNNAPGLDTKDGTTSVNTHGSDRPFDTHPGSMFGTSAARDEKRPVLGIDEYQEPSRSDIAPGAGESEDPELEVGNDSGEDTSTIDLSTITQEGDLRDIAAMAATALEAADHDDPPAKDVSLGDAMESPEDHSCQKGSDSSKPANTRFPPPKLSTASTQASAHTLDSDPKILPAKVNSNDRTIRPQHVLEEESDKTPRPQEGQGEKNGAGPLHPTSTTEEDAESALIKKLVEEGRLEKLIEKYGFHQVKQLKQPSAKFTCGECFKTFSRKCMLRKHQGRHKKPFICTFVDCKRAFGSKNDWKRHESSMHGILEVWECDEQAEGSEGDANRVCRKQYHRRETFKHHLDNVHKICEGAAVDTKLEKCRIDDYRFWCGFCKRMVEISQKGLGAWRERYDHIDDHISGRNGRTKAQLPDWYYPDDEIADWGETSDEGATDQETPEDELSEDNSRRIPDADDDNGRAESPGASAMDISDMPVADEIDARAPAGVRLRPSKRPAKRPGDQGDEALPPKRQKLDTVTVWFCCECGNYIHTSSGESCFNCPHTHCRNCRVEEFV